MAWLKLDDRFAQNQKVRPLSDRAFRLHVVGLLHASAQLTDGKLTEFDVEDIRTVANRATTKHVEELETAGLWHRTKTGWTINDYLKYNPSAEKVEAERERNAERQRRHREGDSQ